MADSFSDPHNERLILIAVGGLILLGLLMAVATVIWWRNNRIEHAALAPLEVMGERSWWKGNFAERRRRLDDARGRAREEHGTELGEAVDLSAAQRSFRPGFADLVEERPTTSDDGEMSGDRGDTSEVGEAIVALAPAKDEPALDASAVEAGTLDDEPTITEVPIDDEPVHDEPVVGASIESETIDGEPVDDESADAHSFADDGSKVTP